LLYKTKRNDKAISVAVSDIKMAQKYVHVNEMAKNIYQNFLPGPVTVVSRGKHTLAKGIESSMGTQGIRIPDYPLILDIVKKLGKPITATSANASYKKAPYTIKDIFDNISPKQKKMVDLILDAGRLPKRKPSTVVDTTLENIHIVREGSISFDEKDKKVLVSNSEKETERYAHKMHGELKPHIGKKNIVVLLQGELGAGKTFFTRHFAKKIGVKGVVNSPTFLLCKEYDGKVGDKKIKLHHMDTYRMYDARELEDLKPEEIFTSPNIVVIEWANKFLTQIEKYLKNAVVLKINIETMSENSRKFEYEITEK
ncbi:MAG: tRNA (adenosine(37)-N6)-threonylcarbamoyltransferase complex ATPase subunit type 1 TsaE, partial [Patescibacteria group bacterium]